MTTFDLGYSIDLKKVRRLVHAVHGKTYMNFQVNYGIQAGGNYDVTISTAYDECSKEITSLGGRAAVEKRIAEFLMNLLMEDLQIEQESTIEWYQNDIATGYSSSPDRTLDRFSNDKDS